MNDTLKIAMLFFFLLANSITNGQVINWTTNFGGEGSIEWASDVILSNDQILVCGLSNSTTGSFPDSNGEDIWVLITDTSGNEIRKIQLGGSASDGGKDIIATRDGGYAILGISFSTDGDAFGANYHGTGDFWIIKLDSLWNIEWQEMYGGSNRDDPQSIIETSDGNFLIAGNTTSSDGDITGFHTGSPIWNDAWVIKLDPLGNIIWQRAIGGSADDAAWSIIEIPSAYVFTGHSESFDGDLNINYGNRDLLVANISKSTGDINWIKTFGGSEMDTGLDIIYTSKNTIAIAGHSGSDDHDVTNLNAFSEFWFLELDTTGNIITNQTYGSPGGDVAYAIEELDGNKFVLTGRAGTGATAGGQMSNLYGNTDAWLIVIDEEGDLIYEKNYGGTRQDDFYGSVLTEEGTLIAVGKTLSDDVDLTQNMGGNDWFVSSISLHKFISVSIPESQYENKISIEISPNPSKGQITITTNIVVPENIQLFDSQGKIMRTLEYGLNDLQVAVGVYYIQVYFKSELPPVVRKLVIQH